ncbi:hypothetical protein [Ralstonia mannitolilytica]|uniref:Uncharacterized protein n=1 Tax=Ralstonia mannitolilytica TaxID=105219 RepID=A0AAD2AKK7_9RALS|nr:hypothetical protein [Ralstonia mannitolilytica]MBY4719881.1 hypothetical protein [Ralstonia mannitolilytica]CAJ0682345.1 hypothetical protein R77591_01794 [Ralstonia mannitolilytica]CAJ0878700.1 hypothetical protein R77569_03011 [Ralstonia mannitolilytica]
MKGQAYRAPNEPALMTESDGWDAAVSHLLGPRLAGDSADRRRRDALQLAAASLRAAGETQMAIQAEQAAST